MDITIRALTPDDFAAWLPLWHGYNVFYDRPSVSDDITQTLWRRLFDPAQPVHALVAEHDGRLVGLTHYLYHVSTSTIEPNCYLQDLYTDETCRGRGVGRALIEKVYEVAKTAGAGRVYWHTHESNATAQALYNKVAEHSGFVVYRHLL